MTQRLHTTAFRDRLKTSSKPACLILKHAVARRAAEGCGHGMQDKSAVNSSLKIQALLFLRSAMARSSPEPWQPYLSQLSSALFKAVGERYYKIAAEALRACEQLMRVIRPSLSQPISQQHMVS